MFPDKWLFIGETVNLKDSETNYDYMKEDDLLYCKSIPIVLFFALCKCKSQVQYCTQQPCTAAFYLVVWI